MNRIITYLLATGHLAVIIQLAVAEEIEALPVLKVSNTQAIIAKDGQKITVRGSVSTVRKSKGGTNVINFEDSEFYLVTFKSDLQTFDGGEPADLYRGKHLAVTGVVSIYKDKPQMKLAHPDMVKIIDPNEPLATPVKSSTNSTKANKTKASERKTVTKTLKKKKKPPVDPKKYFK